MSSPVYTCVHKNDNRDVLQTQNSRLADKSSLYVCRGSKRRKNCHNTRIIFLSRRAGEKTVLVLCLLCRQLRFAASTSYTTFPITLHHGAGSTVIIESQDLSNAPSDPSRTLFPPSSSTPPTPDASFKLTTSTPVARLKRFS